MLHVTCDLCGKELVPGDDPRWVVKIDVVAAHDPLEITEADLEDDNLEAVGELLRAMEEKGENPELIEPERRHFRYDLCAGCQSKFARDPLARDVAQKFDFSEN